MLFTDICEMLFADICYVIHLFMSLPPVFCWQEELHYHFFVYFPQYELNISSF